MFRSSILRVSAVLGLLLSSAAYACPDDPNCNKANCQMEHASTAAAAPAPLPDGPRAALEVSGMSCDHCAEKVKASLMGVKGVKGANVDAKSGKAEVAFDDKQTNIDALVLAVNNTGHFQAKAAPAPAKP